MLNRRILAAALFEIPMKTYAQSRPSIRAFTPIAAGNLLVRDLVDVDVADTEHVGATGQVLDVAPLHLFGPQRDGLVLTGFQRPRPHVESFRLVRPLRHPAVSVRKPNARVGTDVEPEALFERFVGRVETVIARPVASSASSPPRSTVDDLHSQHMAVISRLYERFADHAVRIAQHFLSRTNGDRSRAGRCAKQKAGYVSGERTVAVKTALWAQTPSQRQTQLCLRRTAQLACQRSGRPVLSPPRSHKRLHQPALWRTR